MTDGTLTLFLPVIWAIVAAALGLLLYRSSRALFENVTASTTKKRRIRMTGSVAIAAFAFFAMKWSTPSERLLENRTVLVQQITEVQRATLEAQAAIAVNDQASCKAALLRIDNAASQIKSQLTASK